jgi:hypothetical protein
MSPYNMDFGQVMPLRALPFGRWQLTTATARDFGHAIGG